MGGGKVNIDRYLLGFGLDVKGSWSMLARSAC